MTRKHFMKDLMAMRIPRNTAVAIAEIARTAQVPYRNVTVIGMRPWYDDYTAYITFDCRLYRKDLAERLQHMSAATKLELDKIIRRNRANRKKRSPEDYWLSTYRLSDDTLDKLRKLSDETMGDTKRYIRNLQGSSSDHREFDVWSRFKPSLPSLEEMKYLNFKRSIAGLPALPAPEGCE